jgi:hypothetical protein
VAERLVLVQNVEGSNPSSASNLQAGKRQTCQSALIVVTLGDSQAKFWSRLLTGLGTLPFKECNAGSTPVGSTKIL